MFGSEIVSRLVFRELTSIPAVTEAVGDRLYGLMVSPVRHVQPFCLFYPEFSRYPEGAISRSAADLAFEELRFVVRLITPGEDTAPIRPAAIAQLDHFLGAGPIDFAWDAGQGPEPYQVTFTPQGEVPLTTLVDGGDVSRQLGTVYTVEIARGG